MATSALSERVHVTRNDTGIAGKDRESLAAKLAGVLGDTYTLLIKTHVYHWNVVGPVFFSLHKLTEAQYQDLFEAVDVIAERIRALGHPTPLSFEALLPKAKVSEETTNRTAAAMLDQLIADHEAIVKHLRRVALAADEAGDLVTTDMLTQRLTFHEKAIWMLRATAG